MKAEAAGSDCGSGAASAADVDPAQVFMVGELVWVHVDGAYQPWQIRRSITEMKMKVNMGKTHTASPAKHRMPRATGVGGA